MNTAKDIVIEDDRMMTDEQVFTAAHKKYVDQYHVIGSYPDVTMVIVESKCLHTHKYGIEYCYKVRVSPKE